MRDAWMLSGTAFGVALALAPVERAFAASAAPVDGVWTVAVDCASIDDVEGYNWRFPAEVSSGLVSGPYRSETTSAIGHNGPHPPRWRGGLDYGRQDRPRTAPVSATRVRACRSITRLTSISTDRGGPASETSSAPALMFSKT